MSPRRNTTARTLGNYVIEREIGSGGMGVVLLARQRTLDRPAVLKRLRGDQASSEEFAERLQREARAAAAVHHQNVVAVYDCILWRNQHYIAQEYVDGADLGTILEKCGRFPPRIALLVALEVVRGLEAIHSAGIVHRDVKPANILVGRRGQVKIGDFGIALEPVASKLTLPGVMIGSPAYMAPEQMMGERADSRVDLFSFGVVLYEMLTGALPFPEHDEEAGESILARIRRGRYVPVRKLAPETPGDLHRLVRALLRAKPGDRIQSSADVRRALERRSRHVSAADYQAEIATWLHARPIFEAADGATQLAPIHADPPRRLRRRLGIPIAVGLAAGLTLFLDSHAPQPPALVAFETVEGVTVRVGEGPASPASEPLRLAAGRYHLIFEHPRLGRADRHVEVTSGEELVIEPVFH